MNANPQHIPAAEMIPEPFQTHSTPPAARAVTLTPVDKHSFGGKEAAHARMPREGTFVLPAGVRIVGRLEAEAPLLIEGKFSGELRCSNTVVIAEGAHILGSIDVDGDLVVAGLVEGEGNTPTTIVCRGKLEVASTAHIAAEEVQYCTISIYEGARISGTLRAVQG